jgi:hypothetical protein
VIRACTAAAAAIAAAAALAPEAGATPRNDDLGDAIPVRIGAVVRGNVKGATKQTGEPRHARSSASHTVWYRFAAPGKVAVALNTCRSNFDTVVAVYAGARLRALRVADFNNDGCGEDGGGSRVSFTARAGRSYLIAVAGFRPVGRFRLTVRRLHPPPNDDFADAAPLTVGSTVAGTLVSSTTELDEPRAFAGDTGTVWFRLRVFKRGRVRLEIPACNDSELPAIGVFTGGRVRRLRRVVDDLCDVTWRARAGVTYRVQVTSAPRLQAAFRIRARAL